MLTEKVGVVLKIYRNPVYHNQNTIAEVDSVWKDSDRRAANAYVKAKNNIFEAGRSDYWYKLTWKTLKEQNK